MQCRRYISREEVRQTTKNVSQTIESEGENDLARNLKLKSAIVNTGLSQKEFAERVGVSETHLSSIVGGKRPKLLEQAQRIAKEVGMTVEELWPLED